MTLPAILFTLGFLGLAFWVCALTPPTQPHPHTPEDLDGLSDAERADVIDRWR